MNQGRAKLGGYVGYSSIGFGMSLLSVITNTYILYFYTDVLLLPLGVVSVLLFVVRFFDGAIDPAIGFYMDRRHTRFGKYRGYIILWTLPVCLLHTALFAPPRLSGPPLIVYCTAVFLLWSFGCSMIECAHTPMLITLNHDPAQRQMANTIRIVLSILAVLAASYFPLVLVEKLGGGSERRGFAIAMAIFAALAAAALLPGALLVKERNLTGDNTLSIKRTVHALVHNKILVLLFVLSVCGQISNAVKSQAIVYYMKYNMERADLTATIMTIGVLSSFLTQPLIVWAAKRARVITLILTGYVCACLGAAVMWFSGSSVAWLFAGNILYGVATAFPGNLMFVYTAQVSENISQENSFGGLVTSLLGLSSRLGASLSGAVISGILYMAGYVPNVRQNPAALTGIQFCLGVIPFLACGGAVVVAGLSRRLLQKQFVLSAHE